MQNVQGYIYGNLNLFWRANVKILFTMECNVHFPSELSGIESYDISNPIQGRTHFLESVWCLSAFFFFFFFSPDCLSKPYISKSCQLIIDKESQIYYSCTICSNSAKKWMSVVLHHEETCQLSLDEDMLTNMFWW